MIFLHFLTLFASLANLILGIAVILRGKRVYFLIFSIFCFFTSLWCLLNFLFWIKPKLLLFQGQYALGSVVLLLALLWLTYFLKKKKIKIEVIIYIILLVILFPLPFINGLIIKSLSISVLSQSSFVPGILYFPYGVVFFSFFLLLIYKIFRNYRLSQGIKRSQLAYLFTGCTLFGGISIVVNFVLPFFNVHPVAPFDAQSSLFFVGFATYAIIKHRFMDIRILITRTLIYFILIAIIIVPFVLIGIYYNKFFIERWGIGPFFTSLIIALLIVFGLEPFKKLISRATDKYLFKGKIDYQEVSKHISKIINQELKLQDLITSLSDDLKKQLKLDKVAILLAKNGTYWAEIKDHKKTINFTKDSQLVKNLVENQEILVREEIDRKISDMSEKENLGHLEAIKSLLDQYDFSLVSPIISEQGLIAVLLGGNKLTGEIYSNEDIKFFELLSPQIATAISRAYLYRDLENKVNELSELYKLTYYLSKTLKLEEALDYVMDAVVRLTGCDRGLLYLIDEKNQVLYTVVGKGDKKELYEGIRIKIKESILQKVIITKKPLIVKNVLKTPAVAQYARERLGTKAFIAVPMTVKDKVLGVIGVDNQKSSRPLSDINVSLLQTLAGHAAIAVEDARLYEELNEFNRTLQQKVEKATAEIRKLYEMKGEFLDIASHQLRTPVSVIIGTLDMLQEGSIQKLPKSQQNKFIENAYRKGRKLESIINDILNASEMDTGKFDVEGTTRPVQIENIIDKVMTDFENEVLEKGLKFIFIKPAKKLPLIEVSPRYIEQVINNLIGNAIKYTKQGSIKVQVSQKNQRIIICVKDTGIGIPKEDQPKLFHKFIRAKNARDIYTDGSGLGLFIIKKIVEGHKGGQVWLESEEGRGSSFYVSLPVKRL